ncbi:MAG: hypothetical protein EP335_15480 [Alphaproteobacteria bacterium]|nr:MAG: hypothetical protein EP335_15480 [Alphaproteobacteria bacterium]
MLGSPKDFDQWPLPTEVLAEIGRVTAAWNVLESQLVLFLGKLAGFDQLFDPKPVILFNHTSFPQKLDMLGALCEDLMESYPRLQGYKATIALIKEAQSERNKIVHNMIASSRDKGGYHLLKASARGKLKTEIEPITVHDIRNIALKIDAAATNLYKLVLGPKD